MSWRNAPESGHGKSKLDGRSLAPLISLIAVLLKGIPSIHPSISIAQDPVASLVPYIGP